MKNILIISCFCICLTARGQDDSGVNLSDKYLINIFITELKEEFKLHNLGVGDTLYVEICTIDKISTHFAFYEDSLFSCTDSIVKDLDNCYSLYIKENTPQKEYGFELNYISHTRGWFALTYYNYNNTFVPKIIFYKKVVR